MSGPMDLLAEMQSDIDALEQRVLAGEFTLSHGYDKVNRLRGLRAAMAELIESCGALLGEWDRQDHGMFDVMPAKDWAAAEARFRAALANVGSAP